MAQSLRGTLGVLAFTAGLTIVSGCAANGTPSLSSGPAAARHTQSSAVRLSSYSIDRSKTIVAGISSGGFMAVQLQVAFSQTFHGSAVYAGGPYYCAQDSLNTAELDCMNALGSTNVPTLESDTDAWAKNGSIDPTSNLSGLKAYLWSGTADTTVKQSVMNDLQTYYQHYGIGLTYDNNYPAQHGWESPYGEVACGTAASPYMIDCSNYDSEKTWLTLFYGTLNAKNTGTLGGQLVNFDQTEFGSANALMNSNGYLFVPANCAQGQTCKLVVALHGCLQYQGAIGTKFITEAGIDQWADTNSIIVLYPYAINSNNNPNGCWDWWGYGSANYALQSGPQMAAIKAMVDRIQGTGPVPTPTPGGTPTPAPTPTPVPTPTPTPAPCWNTANYYHVQAGRAHDVGGYAYANGSNDYMGLDNVYYTSILQETAPNYYVVASSGC